MWRFIDDILISLSGGSAHVGALLCRTCMPHLPSSGLSHSMLYCFLRIRIDVRSDEVDISSGTIAGIVFTGGGAIFGALNRRSRSRHRRCMHIIEALRGTPWTSRSRSVRSFW